MSLRGAEGQTTAEHGAGPGGGRSGSAPSALVWYKEKTAVLGAHTPALHRCFALFPVNFCILASAASMSHIWGEAANAFALTSDGYTPSRLHGFGVHRGIYFPHICHYTLHEFRTK